MSNALDGVWELVAFDLEFQDTGERRPTFGASPRGRLAFLPARLMVSLITSDERPVPTTVEERSSAFNSMLAYSRKYEIEGNEFKTHVDLSWYGAWLNTVQVRTYRLAGERLFITSAWAPHPAESERVVRGILEWRRGLGS